MTNHNLHKSIKCLEKDISNCEHFLSRVKNNVSTKTEAPENKDKRTLTKERVDYLNMDLPTTSHTELTSELRNVPIVVSRLLNPKRHRELNKNNSPDIQFTVKTKRSNRLSRNRSRPSGYNRSEDMQPAEFKKQVTSKLKHVLATSKQKTNQNKQQKSSMSWGEVLKKQSKKPRAIGTGKYPQSMSRMSSCVSSDYNGRPVKDTKHYNTEMSSDSESDGSVSSFKAFQLIDKGIQCSLVETSNVHVGSKISSQHGKYLSRTHPVDAFSIFDPVRTLNFLVKELHGFTKKYCNDRPLQRIILDMESTLMRIPKEVQLEDGSGASTMTSLVSAKNTVYPVSTRADYDHIYFKSDIYPVQLHKVVVPSACKIDGSQKSMEHLKLDTDAQRRLKESCNIVENTAYQMEISINKLKSEKHQLEMSIKKSLGNQAILEKDMEKLNDHIEFLKNQVKKSHLDIETMKGKEQDYLQTISIQRKSIHDMSQTISDLTMVMEQLKEENKILPSLYESRYKMSELLNANSYKLNNLCIELNSIKEKNKKLHMTLQMSKMERDKFKVLNTDKSHKLDILTKEIFNIKEVVKDQLVNLNPQSEQQQKEVLHLKLGSTVGSVLLKSSEKNSPLCSSRTSNSSPKPPFDISLLKISSIMPSGQPNYLESIPLTGLSLSSFDELDDTFVEYDANAMEVNKPIRVSHKPTEMVTDKKYQSSETVDLAEFVSLLSESSRCADNVNVLIPSPPQTCLDVEPVGMSQWTDSLDLSLRDCNA